MIHKGIERQLTPAQGMAFVTEQNESHAKFGPKEPTLAERMVEQRRIQEAINAPYNARVRKGLV